MSGPAATLLSTYSAVATVSSRQPPVPVTSLPTASSHHHASQFSPTTSQPLVMPWRSSRSRKDPNLHREGSWLCIHAGKSWGFWTCLWSASHSESQSSATFRIPEMTQFITTLTPPSYRRKQFQLIKALISSLDWVSTFPDSTQAGRRSAADKQMLFLLLFSLNSSIIMIYKNIQILKSMSKCSLVN